MTDDILSALPAGVILVSDAATVGIGPSALNQAVRREVLTRVRPGAFVRAAAWRSATREQRHRWAVHAAARQLRNPVFTHESAAAMWGLPLIDEPDVVHVLGPAVGREAAHCSSRSGAVHRHAAVRLPRVVVRDGVRVTDAATTVATIGASRSLLISLPMADRAVQDRLLTTDDLVNAVHRLHQRAGACRARLLPDLVDDRAGSPGESVSRARMHLDGFVAPRTQVSFEDRGGLFATVDFHWPEVRVVGEFDGRIKYQVDGIPDRRRIEDRLWAEKQREDRLRALGMRVVRWTWADLWHPGALAARLAAAGVPRR